MSPVLAKKTYLLLGASLYKLTKLKLRKLQLIYSMTVFVQRLIEKTKTLNEYSLGIRM
jgi:hypothetical protein